MFRARSRARGGEKDRDGRGKAGFTTPTGGFVPPGWTGAGDPRGATSNGAFGILAYARGTCAQPCARGTARSPLRGAARRHLRCCPSAYLPEKRWR